MVGCTAMLCSSVCVLHERSPWLAVLPCFARVCVSYMSGHLGWLYCHALLECVCLACAVSLVLSCSARVCVFCTSGLLGWLHCHALLECVSCMSGHLGWLYCHALLECVSLLRSPCLLVFFFFFFVCVCGFSLSLSSCFVICLCLWYVVYSFCV